MSGTNPPSSAATARAFEATQSLKRSVQAAFDGMFAIYSLRRLQLCFKSRLYGTSIMSCDSSSSFDIEEFFRDTFTPEDQISQDDGESEPLSHYDTLAEPQEARKYTATHGYNSKVKVLDRYKVVGFISSGTYGRVYKAVGQNGMSGEFAIKKCVYSHAS